MGLCYSNNNYHIKNLYSEEEIKNIKTLNQYFTFTNMEAYICSVYDGDTCTAIININKTPVKFSIRMNGYDCPEMKPSKSKYDRDYEIIFAKMAKDKLKQLILNKKVQITSNGLDKYGRLLGTIVINNLNINNYMLQSGYGYSYSGNTKAKLEYFKDYYTVDGKKVYIKDDHMIQISF